VKTSIHINIFIILLAGLIFGCSNGSTSKGYDTRPIICFGDSLTEGYGASLQQAYPAILGAKIKTAVINAGVSGDTTLDALERVNSDVVKKDPQMVIVLFGANDIKNGALKAIVAGKVDDIDIFLLTTVKDEVKNNLQKMINAIKTGGRKIYLANQFGAEGAGTADLEKRFKKLLDSLPWNIKLDYKDLQNILLSYRKMVKDTAKLNGVGYIDDIWTGIIDNDQYMFDPVHPNAAGYKKMADHIFKAVKPYLQEHNLLK